MAKRAVTDTSGAAVLKTAGKSHKGSKTTMNAEASGGKATGKGPSDGANPASTHDGGTAGAGHAGGMGHGGHVPGSKKH